MLETYKRELLKWNERINLIGPEAREHLDDHINEALAAAEILKPAGEGLDFGSGGGLRPIPMAIPSPEARLELSYQALPGLSRKIVEKLTFVRPASVGQAS